MAAEAACAGAAGSEDEATERELLVAFFRASLAGEAPCVDGQSCSECGGPLLRVVGLPPACRQCRALQGTLPCEDESPPPLPARVAPLLRVVGGPAAQRGAQQALLDSSSVGDRQAQRRQQVRAELLTLNQAYISGEGGKSRAGFPHSVLEAVADRYAELVPDLGGVHRNEVKRCILAALIYMQCTMVDQQARPNREIEDMMRLRSRNVYDGLKWLREARVDCDASQSRQAEAFLNRALEQAGVVSAVGRPWVALACPPEQIKELVLELVRLMLVHCLAPNTVLCSKVFGAAALILREAGAVVTQGRKPAPLTIDYFSAAVGVRKNTLDKVVAALQGHLSLVGGLLEQARSLAPRAGRP